jgi:hypothetical protein
VDGYPADGNVPAPGTTLTYRVVVSDSSGTAISPPMSVVTTFCSLCPPGQAWNPTLRICQKAPVCNLKTGTCN